jgi:hypothetical protein
MLKNRILFLLTVCVFLVFFTACETTPKYNFQELNLYYTADPRMVANLDFLSSGTDTNGINDPNVMGRMICNLAAEAGVRDRVFLVELINDVGQRNARSYQGSSSSILDGMSALSAAMLNNAYANSRFTWRISVYTKK